MDWKSQELKQSMLKQLVMIAIRATSQIVDANPELEGEIDIVALEVDIKEEAKSGLGIPEAIRKDYIFSILNSKKV